ncbi:MAG: hypothetical protein ACUVWR_12235 [Anaerolineae bacterium]
MKGGSIALSLVLSLSLLGCSVSVNLGGPTASTPLTAGTATLSGATSIWHLAPTPTERPAPTVVVPTFAWLPTATATVASGAATSLPTTSGTSISGTATSPPIVTDTLLPGTVKPSLTVTGTALSVATGTLITPTPTLPAYLYVQDGAVTVRPERGCYVGAVFGYVRDQRGQPLAGVRVHVYDRWGNSILAVTKQPPDTGYYDVILGATPDTWYAVVVDALGNQLSPVVTVEHKEGSPGCWYQVDFRRTRAVTGG